MGIEEKFYLAWPFVAFLAWRRRPALRRLGTAALVPAMALAPALIGERYGQFLYLYSQILIGCLVALVLDDPAKYARAARLGRSSARWGVFAAFLLLHFGTPHVPASASRLHHTSYALVTGLALAVVLLGDGPLRQLLSVRPLLLVGRLSYGIYLVHLLALNAAEKLARPGTGNLLVSVAAYVLACSISAVVAYALHRAVERPCIAAGRRLSDALLGRSRGPASAT